jgi:hypothetical protein
MNNRFDKVFMLSRVRGCLPPGMILAQDLDTTLAPAETTFRDHGVQVELGELDKDSGSVY